MARSKAEARNHEFHLGLCGCWGPRIQVILCCLPRCTRRELHQKWRTQISTESGVLIAPGVAYLPVTQCPLSQEFLSTLIFTIAGRAYDISEKLATRGRTSVLARSLKHFYHHPADLLLSCGEVNHRKSYSTGNASGLRGSGGEGIGCQER